MNRRIQVRYACPACGALFEDSDDADVCCRADEVFLCGKRKRGIFRRNPCVHYDRNEARRCQRTDRRLKGNR